MDPTNDKERETPPNDDLARVDAERLIKRAVSGDAVAIDTLVRAHREFVFAFARSAARHLTDAEDLTQEILVEAIRGLGSLKEPERFEGWLSVIAHRVIARWIAGRMSERQRFVSVPGGIDDLSEGVIAGSSPSFDRLRHQRELRETINLAVRELTALQRKMLALHYYDGFSFDEISRQLDIPLGTVKRRMHDSREALRQEMNRMNIAPHEHSKSTPAEMSSVIWGSVTDMERSPFALCRSLIARRILATIGKDSASVPEIAERIGADASFIRDEISRFAENEIVVRMNGERYRLNLFLILKEDHQAIEAVARKMGERAAGILVQEIPTIRRSLEGGSLEKRGFGWETVKWILLAGNLANLSVRDAAPDLFDIIPPLRPSGDRWHAYLIEKSENGDHSAGCNLSYSKEGGTAHLWFPQVKKTSIAHVDADRYLPIFAALAESPRNVAELADDASLSREDLAERLEFLREWGYVVETDGTLRLGFPFFSSEEMSWIGRISEPICERIVIEAFRPEMSEIDPLFDQLGYQPLKEQYQALRAYLGVQAIGHAVAALSKNGALVFPTSEVPATWGFWAWRTPSDVRSPQTNAL